MTRWKAQSWIAVPPWIFLGAVLILLPIFFFWTFQDIQKQKEGLTIILLEKGASLIRSFEAGTRTGMMGMMGMRPDSFQLQRLLMETVQQPDIVHLLVTDRQGTIRAHSDPDRIGETYGKDLDLARIARSEKPEWRLVPGPSGTDAFEVFRKFAPARFPGRGHHGRMTQGSRPPDFPGLKEWSEDSGLIIFVGLDMGPLEEARKGDLRQRVLTALVLLLIGLAGIVLLFLAQAYRTARSSLTRIKAFSDKVVESMPIGLLALDPEGRIVAYNQAAVYVLPSLAPDAHGRMAREVIPTELWEQVAGLEAGKKVLARELDCPLEGDGMVPLDLILSVLEGEDGSFLGHILLFRDMSEVQELKREVETSKRLASLGRLAAGVAHEIRNPLSSIKGFATYFKERYRDVPEDRSTAEIMVREVDRLNRVISDLLEFARPMSIEKRPAAAQALIQHTLKTIQQQARQKGVEIRTALPEEALEVPMDSDKMNQVMLNLFLNAIEAMDKGGTLSVELSPAHDRKGVLISVRDTGSGIRREDLSHIFDPYFTTRPSGTGLGLAIVHKIMESHRGEVRVESEPGRGTTVTLYLPGPD